MSRSQHSKKNIQIQVAQVGEQFVALLPSEITVPGAAPIQPKDNPNIIELNKWVSWDTNDDYPRRVRHLIQKVPIAGATIRKITAKMVGNGLGYYKMDEVEAGSVTRAYMKEVEDFLDNNRINSVWWPAQATGYNYIMNAFGTMILTGDRTKIARIIHRDNEHCRVGLNDKNNKVVDMYHSPMFTEDRPYLESQYTKFPMMEMDAFESTDIINKNKAKFEFGYHTFFPTPGSLYYGIPFWHGLFSDEGWMKVSANIPSIILSLHNNQVSIKYQINIPETYFITRVKDWARQTAVQQKNIIDAKIREINDHLTGTNNVSKSISCVFKEDAVSHQGYGKIEIVAVDDKLKRDAWIPDSNISDAQIVQGLGEHSSQMGLQPSGGKMGAGSGSDQRESYNTAIALNTIDQNILLEPINFISRFNGWGVKFFVDQTLHTTTNNVESGVIPGEGSLEVTKE